MSPLNEYGILHSTDVEIPWQLSSVQKVIKKIENYIEYYVNRKID